MLFALGLELLVGSAGSFAMAAQPTGDDYLGPQLGLTPPPARKPRSTARASL